MKEKRIIELINQRIPAMVSEGVIRLIFQCIDNLETDLPIVEIGIFVGFTTRIMATYCKETGKKNQIIAIDPFEKFIPSGSWEEPNLAGVKEQAEKVLAPFNNVTIIDAYSWDDVALEVDEVAMVFLDGDHTTEAVKKDLLNWLPKTREFFIAHDTHYQSVKRAFEELDIPYYDWEGGCSLVKGHEKLKGGIF